MKLINQEIKKTVYSFAICILIVFFAWLYFIKIAPSEGFLGPDFDFDLFLFFLALISAVLGIIMCVIVKWINKKIKGKFIFLFIAVANVIFALSCIFIAEFKEQILFLVCILLFGLLMLFILYRK